MLQWELKSFRKYLLVKNSKGTVEQLQSFYDTLQVTDDYNPEFTRATIRGALWKGFYSDMMNVSKESHIDFKNGKKPKRLIKQLFKWANRPDGLFLDFFAGSGTTGHAVLELNAEDGGNRKFILCTNNEISFDTEIDYLKSIRKVVGDSKNELTASFKSYQDTDEYVFFKNSDEYADLGICRSVTYERLNRVIKGYTITICDSAFSLEVEALIYTKVRLERKDDYLDYMKKSLAVSSCMKIAGEYSYMAIASFKDIAHLNQFTECLEQNYGQCLVNIVLNKEFVNRPPMDVTSH